MTIHLDFNAWQIAFIVLYLASVVMAWFIMSCVPTSGFRFITLAMAICWPLMFILTPLMLIFGFVLEKFSEWQNSRIQEGLTRAKLLEAKRKMDSDAT